MSPRVLVIDDSPFAVDILAHSLRDAGFDVDIARDLWDLERGGAGKPDLVLLDVVLQETFGDDLVPLLRSMRGLSCPILLVSSLADQELEQRAAEAGVEGYVSKRGGLAAVVKQACDVVRVPVTSPPVVKSVVPFEVSARQRVRRVIHVAGAPTHWHVPAMLADLQALAGDADLASEARVASAARAASDALRDHGASGMTSEIGAALTALAELVGGEVQIAGKLLAVDASGSTRNALLVSLDRAGYVVVEAFSAEEARQRIHAAAYHLVLIDQGLASSDPSLASELKGALPNVQFAVLGTEPLNWDIGTANLVSEINRMVQHPR